MTTKTVHAAHKHNCERCRWLGTIAHKNLQVNACDLYLCDESGMLVARYDDASENGQPDNVTSVEPEHVHDHDLPELVLALDMAIMQGLIDDEGRPVRPW